MLILTIIMMNSGSVLDIMVKPEQRIKDVMCVLAENGKIRYQKEQDYVYVRSWRLGGFVNHQLTFRQAQIHSGDMIYIEVEAS